MVDRLLALAGPSRVGKSWLIQRLREGELPDVAAAIGCDDPSRWDVVTTRRSGEPIAAERVILHYNIVTLALPEGPDRDAPLALIDAAREVVPVTIVTPYAELRRRLAAGRSKKLGRLLRGKVGQVWRSSRFRRRVYGSVESVAALYAEWLAVAARRATGRQWLLRNDRDEVCVETVPDREALERVREILG